MLDCTERGCDRGTFRQSSNEIKHPPAAAAELMVSDASAEANEANGEMSLVSLQ